MFDKSLLILSLPSEHALTDAVRSAKNYITAVLGHANGLEINKGDGSINHFYMI